ncbi:MAG: 16S rRNA (uracil(1498)-N(3))-methyltransferase [Actinobacteria bacterium]|nr:16S rRNA (uracil(1498)-N(3))-methyltransferase [Actinomycetota bacterium]
MSYPYFFLSKNAVKDGFIIIQGNDFEHLVKVLRAKIGETVYISDNAKRRYVTTVSQIEKDSAMLVINTTYEINKSRPFIYLFLCMLKKEAMEAAIQKTAEIGIESITPVISSRAVPELKDERQADKKLARWQQIAVEASKQCKRDFICSINPYVKINDLKISDSSVFFIALEKNARQKTFGKADEKPAFYLDSRKLKNFESVSYIIGPEGGFEDSEIDSLILKGAIPFNFGKNILRSETAAIYFLSVIDYLIKL